MWHFLGCLSCFDLLKKKSLTKICVIYTPSITKHQKPQKTFIHRLNEVSRTQKCIKTKATLAQTSVKQLRQIASSVLTSANPF
jgi:hypothetical protein